MRITPNVDLQELKKKVDEFTAGEVRQWEGGWEGSSAVSPGCVDYSLARPGPARPGPLFVPLTSLYLHLQQGYHVQL